MDGSMTFWQHLDALRGVIIRMAVTVVVAAVAAFVAMPWIFDNVILWPCRPDFPLYRLFDIAGDLFPADIAATTADGSTEQPFNISLININLGAQLMVQLSTSMYLAFVLTFPLLVRFLWSFVSPGLYAHEKRNATRAFLFASVMFYAGIAVAYFLVFPVTLRFLADYTLSATITNSITLDSYIDNFLTITLIMGCVFEMPLLAWLLGRLGLLTRSFFRKYRRHAIVGLLVLAALITPTGDPFTLFVVFAPLYILWEVGAALVPGKAVESEENSAQSTPQSEREKS